MLEMGNTVFAKDKKFFIETVCPTRGLWFETFKRVSKLQMRVIKEKDFRVTI